MQVSNLISIMISDVYESNIWQSYTFYFIIVVKYAPPFLLMLRLFKFWDLLEKNFLFFYLSKAITVIIYSLLKDSTNWAPACPRLAKSEFWMILVATLLIYLQRVLNQVKTYVVLVTTGTFLLCQVISVKVFQTRACIFLLQTSL